MDTRKRPAGVLSCKAHPGAWLLSRWVISRAISLRPHQRYVRIRVGAHAPRGLRAPSIAKRAFLDPESA